jgi:parallel beta-helix repeat protein
LTNFILKVNPLGIFIYSFMKRNLLIFAAVILICFPVFSANYLVTTTADAGAGSLRAAMTSANSGAGINNITFDIPVSDPGYNSGTGIWTINLLSALPYIANLSGGSVYIDASTQGLKSNYDSPKVYLNGQGTIQYGFIMGTSGNTIKGFIIGNFSVAGVGIDGTYGASNNSVINCRVGVDHTGNAAVPNNYGIGVQNGATNTKVTDCIISGNNSAGIALNNCSTVTITGCRIGTNASATDSLPNLQGIAINNSYGNTIGGNVEYSTRNIISGNTDGGVVINGTGSHDNILYGNFIGTDINGTSRIENGNGVVVMNSANNTIGGHTAFERNIISGNFEAGVILNGSGADHNLVKGNYIGTDSSGTQILYNHAGIIIKSNSKSNIIGGSSCSNEKNIISGNSEIGIYIEASDSNIMLGNYIGPDVTGVNMLKLGDTLFQANGVEFNTVSKANILGGHNSTERNIISGNRVYGVVYYGQAHNNTTINNFIGVDVSGVKKMPNATGICVDGGSNHSKIYNNVISGNISYGIFIVTTGTYYNEVKGNLMGTDVNGMDTVANDIAILLGGGAKYNIIGGYGPNDKNIISGNRYEGIEIADIGTDHNQIIGNFIGTNLLCNAALPNLIGVGVSTNPHNNIFDSNVVSGNKRFGFILYEHSDSNILINNRIGVADDGVTALRNNISGVVIMQSSKGNIVGMEGKGNIIANADSSGVVVGDNDSKYNTISCNSIYNNSLPGIVLLTNFANDGIFTPVITTAGYYAPTQKTTVIGQISSTISQYIRIEVFKAERNTGGYYEGKKYIGFTYTNLSGDFCFITDSLVIGDSIVATATDEKGNSSMFSSAYRVEQGNGISETNEDKFIIYPNPARNTIKIFGSEIIKLEMINVKGEIVISQGTSIHASAVKTLDISSLAAGVYFLRIQTNESMLTKKVVVE